MFAESFCLFLAALHGLNIIHYFLLCPSGIACPLVNTRRLINHAMMSAPVRIQLCVTADDLGYCTERDDGIVRALTLAHVLVCRQSRL